MANSEKELASLNKTVTEAVNILKIYVGNSANIKNMKEKERQAIEKWFDVTVEEEQQQKRQRAFTERKRDEHGRFIKKQDDQAKKMMGMAGSITGMFKGMTKTIGTGITNMYQSVSGHFMNFFNNMKSHFLGLFGEESEWFDILGSIKDSVSGFVGWFAKGFSMIFRKTPSWAKDMNKTLQGMYALQIKQMKMDFTDATPAKKKGGGGVWTLLGFILAGIAAGIGAYLHRKLFILSKIIPIKKIKSLFTGIVLRFTNIFEKLDDIPIIRKIKGYFRNIESIPVIGKLWRSIKFGFRWLGWPLTILMSVIDFIRGYKETEGSMFEKIKEGLWKAIEGFIELPVMFIGWVVEKIAGWFGVELTGVGDYNGILDMIDPVKTFFKDIKTLLEPIFTGFFNFFVGFWNATINWIESIIPDFLKEDFGIGDLSGMKMSKIETPSPISTVQQTEKAKADNQKNGYKGLVKAMDDIGKGVQQSNSKAGAAINAVIANQNNQNGGGGDNAQIPDESDNRMVSLQGYNGGYF